MFRFRAARLSLRGAVAESRNGTTAAQQPREGRRRGAGVLVGSAPDALALVAPRHVELVVSHGQQAHPAMETLELNVGGVYYTVSASTLAQDPESTLAQLVQSPTAPRDSKNRVFVDRDGVLFRYVLDFLRNRKLVLPENFREKDRLAQEAAFYNLPALVDAVQSRKKSSGYITIGYRGSFAFGRDGLADVKFRKITRILVCGRVTLCRDVFGETLNESRDPDHGLTDRYTARFFLKHSSIEQAFDMLQEQGFYLTGSCGSGTAGGTSAQDLKPGVDAEESRWNHYNEFVFCRD